MQQEANLQPCASGGQTDSCCIPDMENLQLGGGGGSAALQQNLLHPIWFGKQLQGDAVVARHVTTYAQGAVQVWR